MQACSADSLPTGTVLRPATGAQPTHVDPTLDSCTRYPSLLGGQRQYRMRSLPKVPTHDQCRESNPRPLDLWSSTLPTGPRDPIKQSLPVCNNLGSSMCQSILLTDISDHFPVFCISANALPASNNSADNYVRSYTVQNIGTFKDKLSLVNWTSVTNCFECQSAYSHYHHHHHSGCFSLPKEEPLSTCSPQLPVSRNVTPRRSNILD